MLPSPTSWREGSWMNRSRPAKRSLTSLPRWRGLGMGLDFILLTKTWSDLLDDHDDDDDDTDKTTFHLLMKRDEEGFSFPETGGMISLLYTCTGRPGDEQVARS